MSKQPRLVLYEHFQQPVCFHDGVVGRHFFQFAHGWAFLMNVEWNLHSREGAYAASYAGVGIYSVGRGATDA